METNIYHLKKREYQQIPKIIAEQKQRPLDDWSRSWPVQWWTCSQVLQVYRSIFKWGSLQTQWGKYKRIKWWYKCLSMMRSSEGATNTALKTSQPLNGNIRMARLGILTLSSGWTCFLTNIAIIVSTIIIVTLIMITEAIWPFMFIFDHRDQVNCLDMAVTPECMYNDQTDFVGGDLPQVFDPLLLWMWRVRIHLYFEERDQTEML